MAGREKGHCIVCTGRVLFSSSSSSERRLDRQASRSRAYRNSTLREFYWDMRDGLGWDGS